VHTTLADFNADYFPGDTFCLVDMISGFLKWNAVRGREEWGGEDHEQCDQESNPPRQSMSHRLSLSSRTDECARPHSSRDDLRALRSHAPILETETMLSVTQEEKLAGSSRMKLKADMTPAHSSGGTKGIFNHPITNR